MAEAAAALSVSSGKSKITQILGYLLLSIPDAIITKAYAPIIGMGAVGGTIIGVIIGRFGR